MLLTPFFVDDLLAEMQVDDPHSPIRRRFRA